MERTFWGVREKVSLMKLKIAEVKTYVVLLAELLGERGAHDDTTGAGGGTEMSRARLAAGGGDVCFAPGQ